MAGETFLRRWRKEGRSEKGAEANGDIKGNKLTEAALQARVTESSRSLPWLES